MTTKLTAKKEGKKAANVEGGREEMIPSYKTCVPITTMAVIKLFITTFERV